MFQKNLMYDKNSKMIEQMRQSNLEDVHTEFIQNIVEKCKTRNKTRYSQTFKSRNVFTQPNDAAFYFCIILFGARRRQTQIAQDKKRRCHFPSSLNSNVMCNLMPSTLFHLILFLQQSLVDELFSIILQYYDVPKSLNQRGTI